MFPNSPEAIAERVRAGQVTWTGPVTLTFARTGLAFLAQGVCALVLWGQGIARPYEDAARWMTVWATLVDLGSLALLAFFLRREGLRVRDLFRAREPGSVAMTIASALGYLVGLGAIGFLVAGIASFLLTGTAIAEPPVSHLPLWAGIYSTVVWPVVWGFTEEATYNGYAAPRLVALRGRGIAIAIVALGWAAQHFALPFRADATFLALRFLPSAAIAVVAVAMYLKTRRLLPLALAHALIDAGTGALTLR